MHGALRETFVWNSMWNNIGNYFHFFHKVLALEVIFRKYVHVACFSKVFIWIHDFSRKWS